MYIKQRTLYDDNKIKSHTGLRLEPFVAKFQGKNRISPSTNTRSKVRRRGRFIGLYRPRPNAENLGSGMSASRTGTAAISSNFRDCKVLLVTSSD